MARIYDDITETVGERMTTECHTVDPRLDLFGLADTFVRLRVRPLPVPADGRLVGQVSRRDVLRAALQRQSQLQGVSRPRPAAWPVTPAAARPAR